MTLELRQLTLTRGTKQICRELSLSLCLGNCIGILGANGVGKSTLLHAMAGLFADATAHIYLNQTPLSQFSTKSRAKQMGLLFQDAPTTFKQRIWDFCLSSRYPYHAIANNEDVTITEHALDQMDLLESKYKFSDQLSGGEYRRLQIAALLTQQPTIYLLDEPINHLDHHYQMRVLKLFNGLAKSKQHLIIMVLHDVNLALHFCDNVILVFPDNTIQFGPAKQLISKDNLRSLYQYPMQQHADLWFPMI